MKKIAVPILLLCLTSCVIQERINTGAVNIVSSLLMSQIAGYQILVESIEFIYEHDSLKYDSEIYIDKLKTTFVDDTISGEIEIDSIKATINDSLEIYFYKIDYVGDSIIYTDVLIPHLIRNFNNDTVQLNVQCYYVPDFNFRNEPDKFKMIRGHYIMTDNKIIKVKDFEVE